MNSVRPVEEHNTRLLCCSRLWANPTGCDQQYTCMPNYFLLEAASLLLLLLLLLSLPDEEEEDEDDEEDEAEEV